MSSTPSRRRCGQIDCHHSAIDLMKTPGKKTYVLSEDVDLLVLLVGLYDNPLKNVLFLVKPGRKGAPWTLFDIGDLQNTIPHLKRYIFFVHAITGCDYISAIFQKGKTSAWMLCQTLPNNTIVPVFNNPQSCNNEVYESSCRFPCLLYKASENVTTIGINYLRYVLFSKCLVKRTFRLQNLPPTAKAARQHWYRVYLTIQRWLGNNLEPTEWEWRSIGLRARTCWNSAESSFTSTAARKVLPVLQ